MWLFTRYGFFSVVQDHHKRKNVVVRARNRQHLIDLFVSLDFHSPESAKQVIEETPERDYRYRVSIDRRAYAGLLQSLAMDVDYPNFKNEGMSSGKFRKMGAEPLPGYQLRYIYLIDKEAKLAVPSIPFEKIKELGAGMYRGQPRA